MPLPARPGFVARCLCLAAAAITLVSCSNAVDTGANPNPSAAPTVSAGGKLHFAMVTHGAPGDPFWSVVKNGATQAARDFHVKVTYQSSPDPQTQSQYVDAATNQHVDGLIVSLANPGALKSSVRNAERASVPVVTINAGENVSKQFGALVHIGQNETIAGRAAGKRLQSMKLHHVLCVIHEAGNVSLEQRCNGVKQTFGGKVDEIQVNVNDLQSAESTIKSKLQQDKSIDGVLSLNPAIATTAVTAKRGANSKATVATFDESSQVIHDVQHGSIAFAVDQQPYLQGYLPVQTLYLYATNGNVPGGGKPVLTGPSFITKHNAARVARFAARGTR